MTTGGMFPQTSVSERIAAELSVRVWSDPKVAADFKKDPNGVIALLCGELGVSPAEASNIVIQKSPVGDLPFEGPEMGLSSTVYGCGGVGTLTAECGCSYTTTGGCSCFSIYGTPCLGCVP